MDVTTQRRCLVALAAGLFAGAAGAVGWSVSAIDGDATMMSQVPSTVRENGATTSQTATSLDLSFASRPLRRPLQDPPPPPPPPEPVPQLVEERTPPPKLDVTLVGTIIQPDQSLAIVADSSGAFDVKGIGQALELSTQGIIVQRIEPEQVTLRFQDRDTIIELSRPGIDAAGVDGIDARPARPGAGGRRRNNR
jgi:hypothetical protein